MDVLHGSHNGTGPVDESWFENAKKGTVLERSLYVIFPFLGSSHLADALDHGGAHGAFHGHAHNGSCTGETPGGVPVFNVSVPVLQSEGFE